MHLLELLGLTRRAPASQPPSQSDAALAEAAQMAEEFEGLVLHPYQDPTGVWTIGYGSTRCSDGTPVNANTPNVTQAEAQAMMERDMRSACTSVEGMVTTILTADEEAALIDFTYNVGAGNLKASTLLRKLNAGDYAGASAEFPKWNLAGGKVLAGLVRRRAVEQALFDGHRA